MKIEEKKKIEKEETQTMLLYSISFIIYPIIY